MVTLSRNSCFLSSKKFNKEGVDIGEKVSFFLVDPSKESAIDNLHAFLSQTKELLSLFLTSEISKGFDR
jgi:hypothetical protein